MNSTIYASRPLSPYRVDDSGDLILHNQASGEMIVLNAVGAATFELVDGQRTVDAIVAELCEIFDNVPRDQIADDVTRFLDNLVERGIVTPLSTP